MSSHPGVQSVTLSSAGTNPALRGIGTLRIQHDKSGIIWRISQMAVLCVPTGQMTVETYFNDLPLMPLVTVYSGACADGEPSIDLGDHDTLKVNITYGPPGANVVLAYYFEEIVSG